MRTTGSSSSYIERNDIEGAVYRFNNTIARYKQLWFDTIAKILEKCPEYAKEYVLDPIRMTVEKIIQKTKAKVTEVVKVAETAVEIIGGFTGLSNTYLIKMYDENDNHIFTKIGKANDINVRMRQLSNHEYKRDMVTIKRCEVVKFFEVKNEDIAQALESLMRSYFRTKYSYIPNDRFHAFEPSEEDLTMFETYYNLVNV